MSDKLLAEGRKKERKKERKKNNSNNNNNKKRSKHNMSPKLCLRDIIMLYILQIVRRLDHKHHVVLFILTGFYLNQNTMYRCITTKHGYQSKRT